MKLSIALVAAAAVLLAGCGPSAEEKAEAARKAAEEKAEAAAAMVMAEKLELIEICKDDLRDRVKDPESLRVLSYGARLHEEVEPPKYFSNGEVMWGESDASAKFTYTATNSYGGRIKKQGYVYSLTGK